MRTLRLREVQFCPIRDGWAGDLTGCVEHCSVSSDSYKNTGSSMGHFLQMHQPITEMYANQRAYHLQTGSPVHHLQHNLIKFLLCACYQYMIRNFLKCGYSFQGFKCLSTHKTDHISKTLCFLFLSNRHSHTDKEKLSTVYGN